VSANPVTLPPGRAHMAHVRLPFVLSGVDQPWRWAPTVLTQILLQVGQASYDRTQLRLLHRFSRFLDTDPLDVTLAPFWPLFPLPLNLQWKNLDLAGYDAPVLEAFFVCKRPNGAAANRANNTSFFTNRPQALAGTSFDQAVPGPDSASRQVLRQGTFPARSCVL
jgi:hypothetical protein